LCKVIAFFTIDKPSPVPRFGVTGLIGTIKTFENAGQVFFSDSCTVVGIGKIMVLAV
jgi:hypothetical protein